MVKHLEVYNISHLLQSPFSEILTKREGAPIRSRYLIRPDEAQQASGPLTRGGRTGSGESLALGSGAGEAQLATQRGVDKPGKIRRKNGTGQDTGLREAIH